jgi:hypothetical protein
VTIAKLVSIYEAFGGDLHAAEPDGAGGRYRFPRWWPSFVAVPRARRIPAGG